jgi:hypothetical protein
VYRYSHEPDYRSHTVGLSLQQGVWDNTGTLLLNVAGGRDVLATFLNKSLNFGFVGAAYSQALSPTLVAQAVYDVTYQEGFVGNPYYVQPNLGHENPPDERLRHAVALRIAKYIPQARLGFQLHGRLYFDQHPPWTDGADPWRMIAKTGEARIYATVLPGLEARLSWRVHNQGRAAFWCSTPPGALMDCYLDPAQLPRFGRFSADEKFGPLTTHFPELKLTYELEPLAGLLRVLSRGAVEVSYGYFLQTTHYGNAHVLQLGYTLPL